MKAKTPFAAIALMAASGCGSYDPGGEWNGTAVALTEDGDSTEYTFLGTLTSLRQNGSSIGQGSLETVDLTPVPAGLEFEWTLWNTGHSTYRVDQFTFVDGGCDYQGQVSILFGVMEGTVEALDGCSPSLLEFEIEHERD